MQSSAPRWMIYVVALAGLLAAVIMGTYFIRFWSPGQFGDQSAFGQFGDYVGGVLNPLLSSVTLLTLLWSMRTQAEQLAASHKALEQAQKLHREQLDIQRSESIRLQLKSDTDLYVSRCEELLNAKILLVSTFAKPLGELLSLSDLFKNPAYFGQTSVGEQLLAIPELLKANDALSLHLNTVRTQLSSAVYSACNLIEHVELKALRTSIQLRLISLITDVRCCSVLTDEEAEEFKVSLVGAQLMAAERYAAAKRPDAAAA